MNNQTKTLTSMISSSADFRFKLQKELQYSNHASEWEIFQHFSALWNEIWELARID